MRNIFLFIRRYFTFLAFIILQFLSLWMLFKYNMAVLSSDGAAVGVVVNVSANFSEVMSLLHVQNSVSGALKSTGDAGKVEWDGKDPAFVLLKGISKSIQVKVGDTVVTSKYSY